MSDTIYDIAIVGGGPAGLSAALTGRIRNKKILLFEHRPDGKRQEYDPDHLCKVHSNHLAIKI